MSNRPTTGHNGIAARLAFMVLLSLTTAFPISAGEEENPAWKSILSLQLKDTYNCVLDEIEFVREVPVAGKLSTEGRVRCIDRREFDFSRSSPHEKFTLRICQPTVC